MFKFCKKKTKSNVITKFYKTILQKVKGKLLKGYKQVTSMFMVIKALPEKFK
jgi:hypothetical protein